MTIMTFEQVQLTDDGRVPNHPTYPLIIYKGAFLRGSSTISADEAIERFSANGWSGAWVNGIFPYHHYHACSHEVLANLGEPVDVQFGGASGPVVTFETGAVVAIPAGGGHCKLSKNSRLVIVGAYPTGQENWDLKRADNVEDYAVAKAQIAAAERPKRDPVFGADGPVMRLWL